MTQVKYGMNLIQTDANKLLLIGGVTDSGYSNEVEVFDLSDPGHTTLDTAINTDINAAILAIKLGSSILIATENSYMISNKITGAPTSSPTIQVLEDASNAVLLSPNPFIYTVAIVTSISLTICVCCVGVLSVYCIMRTNKRLKSIMKDDDNKEQSHQIPNSSKCSSAQIDTDILSTVSSIDQAVLTINKLYDHEMEPGISAEIIEQKQIELNVNDEQEHLTKNDNAMSPSEGAKFYEQRFREYMEQLNNISAKNAKQHELAMPTHTNDGDVETELVNLESNEFIVDGDSDEEVLDELDTRMFIGDKYELPDQEKLHLDDLQSLSSVQYEGLRMKHRYSRSNRTAFNPPLKQKYSGYELTHPNQVSR